MRVLILLMLTILVTTVQAAGMKLDTDKQQLSYAIGAQIGSSLKNDGLDIDAKIVGMAISDVLSGAALQLTPEQMQLTFKSFQEKKAKDMQTMAMDNLKKGQAYMLKYSKEKGVTALDNGLHYKVLTKGSGKKPMAEDTVIVHYRGTLINGDEFDSSYKRGKPATFAVNAVIEGWQEILPLMPSGSKWQVVIPAAMAYGQRGTGGQIGANETLIFEIELLEIK